MRLVRPVRLLVPIFAFLALAAPPARAALSLSPVFGPRMVLQAGLPVPVWGAAGTGETVVVEFAGQRQETAADASGRWRVTFAPLAPSAEARTLTVTASPAGRKETVSLEGVLVGEVWVGSGQSNMAMLGGSYTNQDAVLAANAAGVYPLLRLYTGSRGGWVAASTNDNLRFSALLFSFGLRLHQELGVPVGLMVGARGGTPSGYWLSERAFQDDPACQAEVEKAKAAFRQDAYDRQWAAVMTGWSQQVEKVTAEGGKAPGQPRPALKPGESYDRIGHLYEAHIRPFQPMAIRGVLWDQGESGTGIGGVSQPTLMNALVTGWRREWRQDFPFLAIQKPSGGGRAWDPKDPVTLRADLPAPLPAEVPHKGHGREEYLKVGLLSNVFLVASTDLGGGTHPINKSGYGARAARVALGAVYQRPVAISGPAFKSFTVKGGQVRVAFTHIGQGLATPPSTNSAEALQGFAIAGTNRLFHWAKGTIDGETVVLESAAVPAPVAVRYGWADRHPWANLFNRDGLPAQAFRTDAW